MTKKMERGTGEGSGNWSHQEMHRLPSGHPGAWANAAPWEGGCTEAAHGTEQSPNRRPIQCGQVGIGQWWCHFKTPLKQERDGLFNKHGWDN